MLSYASHICFLVSLTFSPVCILMLFLRFSMSASGSHASAIYIKLTKKVLSSRVSDVVQSNFFFIGHVKIKHVCISHIYIDNLYWHIVLNPVFERRTHE